MIRDNELNFVFQKSTVHANKQKKKYTTYTKEREKYFARLVKYTRHGIGGMRCRQQIATTYSEWKEEKKTQFFFLLLSMMRMNKKIYI